MAKRMLLTYERRPQMVIELNGNHWALVRLRCGEQRLYKREDPSDDWIEQAAPPAEIVITPDGLLPVDSVEGQNWINK